MSWILPMPGVPNEVMYPPIEPYRSGQLQVSEIHSIYFEESGRADGKPVVFLHGGPGGGAPAGCRRLFDPQKYRIVLFDQRGCQRSLPFGSLRDNTTWHLVDDIEALRKHLGIDRWQVFGGSWGSALGLAYAETYPAAVSELVLRGVCLGHRSQLDWVFNDGANRLFPDAWERFIHAIPTEKRDSILQHYYERLSSHDLAVQEEAARAWIGWESSLLTLIPGAEQPWDSLNIYTALFECYYLLNNCFFRDGQLLKDVHKIAHIPVVIVQGRYDLLCPMSEAWALSRALPKSELIVVPDAGHVAGEPGTLSALVAATDRLAATMN